MKKILVNLVMYFFISTSTLLGINLTEINQFDTKQKQWYQAYLYEVFPKLSAMQLIDIEIMRINNEAEFEDNIKWINNTYDIIDMALNGSEIVSSNKNNIIINLAKVDIRNYLSKEYGNVGETIGFVADVLSELYNKGKKASLLSKLSVVSYSARRISKVEKAVHHWYRYSDITERQLSLLIVDNYLKKSIKNAQCINISENYIESLAEELKIDTGWTPFTRDYDVDFTISKAREYCYYLSSNYFKYDGNYPQSIKNQPPQKPKITINGSTYNTSLTPTFVASNYIDNEQDSHIKTWWGIYEKGKLKKDFGWKSTNKYSFKIPTGILNYGKKYAIAVAFKDSKNNDSKAKFLYFNTKDEGIQLYANINEVPLKYFSKRSNICDNKNAYNCKNNKYDILYMQMLLNSDDNLKINLTEDGVWGDNTRKAVMKFQAYYGLTIDGIVGFGTRGMLDSVLAGVKDNASKPVGIKYQPFLELPLRGSYTHGNAPISSVFDHTLSNDSMVIAFDGTTAKKEYGKNSGSCYMVQNQSNIILENAKYVGTHNDSHYLCYDATGKDKHRHTGIDYAVGIGTNIYASASGTVEFAGTQTDEDGNEIGFGKYIKINHHNGFATYYGHLSNMNIHLGDQVTSGQYIGKSGNSGGVAAHLHFDVRKCASTIGTCNVVRKVDPFGFMGINNLWKTNENSIDKADVIVLDTKIDTVMNDGESYVLEGTVQNIGDTLAKNVELTFYVSDDDMITSEDTPIGTYYNFGDIESKEHKSEDITIIADRTWNKKYIGACVSSTSDETSTNNNCKVSGYIYVKENDYVEQAPYLKLYDYKIDDYATNKSDGDGQVENDEWVQFGIKLKNIGGGKATDVRVSLDTDAECVSIVHASTSFLNIESGEKIGFGITEFAFDDCLKNQKIIFDVKITADDEYEWHDSFTVTIIDDREPADLELVSFEINDDNKRSSRGNSDGNVNLGEILEIYPSIRNNGDINANNVKAYLSSSDQCVDIIDNDTRWNDIKEGEYIRGGEYNKDSRTRFKVRVKPSCAIGHRVNFNIKVISDEGTWYDSYSFKIKESISNLDLKIVDYKITRDVCNEGFWHTQNQIVNPCDDIDMDLKLKNSSNQKYSQVFAYIETDSSCIEMREGEEVRWYDLNESSLVWQTKKELNFKVSSSCQPGTLIKFYVTYIAKKVNDSTEYISTDDFSVPVRQYSIKPDLSIDRVKPKDFIFNEAETANFIINVENNGDNLIEDSTWLNISVSDSNSCNSNFISIGNVFVPPFYNEDDMDLNFNIDIQNKWNNKYLIVKVMGVNGETNLEDNCFVGEKITVLFDDSDGDGISNVKEEALGLNPNNPDTDGDGISDLEEVGDINNPRDSDGDGIIDAIELDSDNDGASDADERVAGTDPTDKNDKPVVKRIYLSDIDDVYVAPILTVSAIS